MRRLLTIPISHYCEKARWALDRAGMAYAEERHVQGIHQVVARRAGGGMTLPVLIDDDAVLTESEDILRHADRRLEEPWRLFPADPALRDEVVELQPLARRRPRPRRPALDLRADAPAQGPHAPLQQPGRPRVGGAGAVGVVPVIGGYARRLLDVDDDTVRDDGARVERVFDAIAERLADGRPFLCGERFTAADLTFAALAAPVTAPPGYGVRLPEPDELPAEIGDPIRAFRAHPAGAFALRLYRTERPKR